MRNYFINSLNSYGNTINSDNIHIIIISYGNSNIHNDDDNNKYENNYDNNNNKIVSYYHNNHNNDSDDNKDNDNDDDEIKMMIMMIIMIIVMMIIIAITRQYHYRNHYNHCHYFITTNNFKCSSEVAEIQNVFQYSNNSQYERTRTTRICLYYEYSKCNLYYCSAQENLHPILLVHAGNLLESSKIVLGFF